MPFRSITPPAGVSTGVLKRSLPDFAAKPSDWTFSAWVYWNGAVDYTRLAASKYANERIATGTAAQTILEGQSGGAGAYAVATGLAANGWSHIHVVYDNTAGLITVVINNGTPATDAGTTPAQIGQGWGTGWQAEYTVGGDETSAAKWDGLIFDMIAVSGVADTDPTNFNYSTANGGEWVDYAGSFGSWGWRLTGENASDPGEDASGNGNHFSQTGSGADLVTLDGASLPPGAAGGPTPITGTASATSAADTASAAGSVGITGSASAASAEDDASAAASIAISGTTAASETSDQGAATADVSNVGSAAAQESDSAVAAGSVPVEGVATLSEADSASGAGSIAISGTASADGADTSASSGAVAVTGAGAAQEQDDVGAASGSGATEPGTGTANATDDDDAASATGALSIAGTGSATVEDTAQASAAMPITGTATAQEVSDTASASAGAPATTGTGSATEEDHSAAAGTVGIAVHGSASESDTASATATLRITGTATATDDDDTALIPDSIFGARIEVLPPGRASSGALPAGAMAQASLPAGRMSVAVLP